MNKSFVAIGLIAALAVGYGIRILISKPSPPPTGPCAVPGANKHCADVTILNNAIQAIAPIQVPGKSQVIFWNIVTSGYTFPANGISTFTPVPPTTGVPPNEFNCGVLSSTVFFCVDANSTHGSGSGTQTYKYTVTVNGSSPAPVVLDPQIVNN